MKIQIDITPLDSGKYSVVTEDDLDQRGEVDSATLEGVVNMAMLAVYDRVGADAD